VSFRSRAQKRKIDVAALEIFDYVIRWYAQEGHGVVPIACRSGFIWKWVKFR
jgi:hypothetical protein